MEAPQHRLQSGQDSIDIRGDDRRLYERIVRDDMTVRVRSDHGISSRLSTTRCSISVESFPPEEPTIQSFPCSWLEFVFDFSLDRLELM